MKWKSETLARNVPPKKTHTHTKGKEKKCEIGIVHVVRPARSERIIMREKKKQNDKRGKG
jgi:hypothetical protein